MYRGNSGSFDRSLFLSLYNRKRWQYSLKSYRVDIEDPRLAIFAAAHLPMVIDMLEEEKTGKSDAFISRFLLCCPPRANISVKDQPATNVYSELKYDLVKLFLAIRATHRDTVYYKFNERSRKTFSDEVDRLFKISERVEDSDSFIA